MKPCQLFFSLFCSSFFNRLFKLFLRIFESFFSCLSLTTLDKAARHTLLLFQKQEIAGFSSYVLDKLPCNALNRIPNFLQRSIYLGISSLLQKFICPICLYLLLINHYLELFLKYSRSIIQFSFISTAQFHFHC